MQIKEELKKKVLEKQIEACQERIFLNEIQSKYYDKKRSEEKNKEIKGKYGIKAGEFDMAKENEEYFLNFLEQCQKEL